MKTRRNTQEDFATTERWQKRKVRRPPYICCVYSMHGVVYLSSFLSLFHCRLVFLYSVSSFLTCFCIIFTGPSLLEIKFCGNFWHSSIHYAIQALSPISACPSHIIVYFCTHRGVISDIIYTFHDATILITSQYDGAMSEGIGMPSS